MPLIATNKTFASELNPEPSAHNAGQPLKENLDKHGKQRTKFLTECAEEHAASLQCISDNYDNRNACQQFFDAYKQCRREEKQRYLEKNQKGARSFVARHDYLKRRDTATISSVDKKSEKPRLALLTFDLDDTLFPIGQVVQDANEAMVQAMHRLGYTKATNKNVLKHVTAIRKHTKQPITYTSLRMRAIHAELDSNLKKGETVDYSVVKHCFDAWLDERHSSAERNLFPGAVEMLTSVSALHPYACIGAITNGRGSPISMSSISQFFDFCVSGEDDNVFPHRKPQRGIYEASLQKYAERYPHPISDDYIWCHVGDCLANDVGGSTKCGAYAIWMDADHEKSSALSGKQPTWSTASKRTIRNRQRLANSAKGSVSAKITRLSDLPGAIDVILEKAGQSKQIFF